MKQGDRFTVDRVENGIAVLECGNGIKEIGVTEITCPVEEGDVLVWDGKIFSKDQEQTVDRKKALYNKQRSLFK